MAIFTKKWRFFTKNRTFFCKFKLTFFRETFAEFSVFISAFDAKFHVEYESGLYFNTLNPKDPLNPHPPQIGGDGQYFGPLPGWKLIIWKMTVTISSNFQGYRMPVSDRKKNEIEAVTGSNKFAFFGPREYPDPPNLGGMGFRVLKIRFRSWNRSSVQNSCTASRHGSSLPASSNDSKQPTGAFYEKWFVMATNATATTT